MQQKAPALLPIFRSGTQLELLGLLFVGPQPEYTIADLARRLGVHPTTVGREADRLVGAGLATSRSLGRSTLVAPNWSTAIAAPLGELLARTIGPLAAISEIVHGLPGLVAAYVFGSWAARFRGVTGPPPRDLDVLLVGDVSALDAATAARAVEARTGLRTDVTVVSPDEWSSVEPTPFLADVRDRPLVEIELEGGDG